MNWLVATAVVTTAVALVLSYYSKSSWPQDLFMGIAGSAFSVLLAVAIVDRIIEAHDEEQWEVVEDFVLERISRVATVVISSIRQAFGTELDSSSLPKNFYDDREVRIVWLVQSIRETIRPRIDTAIPAMDEQQWATLKQNISNAFSENERILAAFGSRITPTIQVGILQLSDELFGLLTVIDLYAGILGVPEARRSPNLKFSLEQESQMTNRDTINRTRTVLGAVECLLGMLGRS